ncbi:MAG: hypothetical protein JW781_01380 [Deltaproteobacteria bacterium]|nr:hypothetical protein [Candidatus Anaeroferrophillacea bacterium]
MTKKHYEPCDFSGVRTYPIAARPSKVNIVEHFAATPRAGAGFAEFLAGLPDVLAARDLRALVAAIVAARQGGRPVVLALGGHVIKCGLQPVLKSLIAAEVVTAVAMNGAVAIHDWEVSLVGATSEDVGAVLHGGEFGFAVETGRGMNAALARGREEGVGYGRAIGNAMIRDHHPYRDHSLLALCAVQGIPATVHVAVGTDIIHQHPEADGAVIGELSMLDFRLLTSVVADLRDGVWINVGSAVLLPEVFLKALSVVRNLGHDVSGITTANFDMVQHYRPRENVVRRPTLDGQGAGYAITGHHEIMLPLLAHAVLDGLRAVAGPPVD